MLALVRSSNWEWALFFHILGALFLVGAMVLVVTAALVAERAATPTLALRRLTLRALLFLVVPSFILMRATAEWVRTEDAFADDAGWIGLGYAIADSGVVVLLALVLLAWWARRSAERDLARSRLPGRIVAALAPLYLVALLVAVWAMTTKPD